VQVFRVFPIASALAQLFSEPDVAKQLRLQPFITHERTQPDLPSSSTNRLMKNVYDSAGWRLKVIDSGFAADNDCNIVLSMATDGFQPADKGAYSIWPILFEVLNLPEELRYKTNMMIMAGIVPGPNKPKSMSAYLNVIVDELNHLYLNGVPIHDSYSNTTKTIKVLLLFTIADYPAHGLVNCQQGAGADWGCHKCMVKGARPGGLNKHIYQLHGRDCAMKTHDLIDDEAEQLEYEPDRIGGSDTNGVTGRSALFNLPNRRDHVLRFDVIKDTMIDPMHVLEGFWKSHIIKLLAGERDTSFGTHSKWLVKKREMDHADAAYQAMLGPSDIAPQTRKPFLHKGKANKHKRAKMRINAHKCE
jgi:hypothetical protein